MSPDLEASSPSATAACLFFSMPRRTFSSGEMTLNAPPSPLAAPSIPPSSVSWPGTPPSPPAAPSTPPSAPPCDGSVVPDASGPRSGPRLLSSKSIGMSVVGAERKRDIQRGPGGGVVAADENMRGDAVGRVHHACCWGGRAVVVRRHDYHERGSRRTGVLVDAAKPRRAGRLDSRDTEAGKKRRAIGASSLPPVPTCVRPPYPAQ